MEISVYAVYPDTCGRSYPYIFVYADVTVSEPVFFRARFSTMAASRLSFLCNAHALLTNPLRCLDTNRIRVDGRIRYMWTQIFFYPHKKIADTKISGYVWTGPLRHI